MSLRSFSTHYRSAGAFWVIGHIPSWLDRSQVRCVPWGDPHARNKDANLIEKAARIAEEPDLSGPVHPLLG